MNGTHAIPLAGLILSTVMTSFAVGQTPPPSLVGVVADGRPWAMAMENGDQGTLTLTPGGTGVLTMKGRSLNPTWREGAGGQLCIKPVPIMPESCATLRREGQAVVGFRSDGTQGMRLTR